MTCKHLFDKSGICFECGKEATAGEYCKSQGTTLSYVSTRTGVSLQTLTNWHKNKSDLFKIVVLGVLT